jgi:hypothetical protein
MNVFIGKRPAGDLGLAKAARDEKDHQVCLIRWSL